LLALAMSFRGDFSLWIGAVPLLSREHCENNVCGAGGRLDVVVTAQFSIHAGLLRFRRPRTSGLCELYSGQQASSQRAGRCGNVSTTALLSDRRLIAPRGQLLRL